MWCKGGDVRARCCLGCMTVSTMLESVCCSEDSRDVPRLERTFPGLRADTKLESNVKASAVINSAQEQACMLKRLSPDLHKNKRNEKTQAREVFESREYLEGSSAQEIEKLSHLCKG